LSVKTTKKRTIVEDFEKKGLPFLNHNYNFIEYSDYFQDGNSKKLKCKELGKKFASINSYFFEYLKGYNIPVAFLGTESKNLLKFIKFEKCNFHIKVLNHLDKRTAKIFDKKEGDNLNLPLYEFHYGDDKDSLISESHLLSFDLCSYDHARLMTRICSKINAVLRSFFERRNLLLAEVNCYFGKNENKIYVIDDFTPKSIKVFPLEKNSHKFIDPYKLDTAPHVKNYTDQIFHLTSI
jgi:phosphoribosylaminoimidazole-succinocarboxamide synthase